MWIYLSLTIKKTFQWDIYYIENCFLFFPLGLSKVLKINFCEHSFKNPEGINNFHNIANAMGKFVIWANNSFKRSICNLWQPQVLNSVM